VAIRATLEPATRRRITAGSMDGTGAGQSYLGLADGPRHG
jgi:hypothetical protein